MITYKDYVVSNKLHVYLHYKCLLITSSDLPIEDAKSNCLWAEIIWSFHFIHCKPILLLLFLGARAKTETVSMLTYLIGFNSCLNPFIYLGFNWRSIFVKSKGREATSIVMSLSHYNSTQQRKAAHTEAEELDNLYPCSGEESKEECLHTTSDSMLNLPKWSRSMPEWSNLT